MALHAPLVPLLVLLLLLVPAAAPAAATPATPATPAAPQGPDPQSALFALEAGPGPLGQFLDAAGDVDGDGTPDLVANRGAKDAVALSGRTGLPLVEVRLPGLGVFEEGLRVSGAGDVDGDGLADLLLGDPVVAGGGGALVVAGAGGAVLHSLDPPPGAFSRFGAGVDLVGDVDGDGVPDHGAGAPNAFVTGVSSGEASVHRGSDGTALLRIPGPLAQSDFGWAVAGAGDLDRDGVPDLVVGGPRVGGPGLVRACSGATGATLWSVEGGGELGFALAAAGDVDLDGVPDVLAGRPAGGGTGEVWVLAGADGAGILAHAGVDSESRFGHAVAGLADVTGDGVPEVLGGAPAAPIGFSGHGYARLLCGATGALLLEVDGASDGDLTGAGVTTPGDLNQDGVPDLAVAAANAPGGGVVHALSPTPLALAADGHLASVAGGTQALSLAAGPAHGGAPYVVAGSLAGVVPGLAVGGAVVPLNPDAYLALTLAAPDATLVGASGALDGAGAAAASFVVPPGLGPGAVGLTAHHAFAVLAGGGVALASNAVPVTLVE